MSATTATHYLQLASQIITDRTHFSQEREARVRSLTRLAEVAVAVEDLAKRHDTKITYASERDAAEFRSFLATGKFERRDMASGGAYPGSGSGYFVPVGFFPSVIAMLKQLDDLFDEKVVHVFQTKIGSPQGIPVVADDQNVAVTISDNQPYSNADALMDGVILPECPKWASGFYASIELVQDSGVPLDQWVAAAFAIRLQRGLGAVNVTNLLAGATLAATGVGNSGNTGGSGTGANSIGSDDLLACINALDAAYLNSEKCAWVMNKATLATILGTKNKQGGLVYSIDRGEDGTIYLLDIPVRISPSMPSIGANAQPVALGDLSRLVLREVQGGMALSVFPERGATSGQVYYRGEWRAQSALIQTDNSPADPSPAVYLQCASS